MSNRLKQFLYKYAGYLPLPVLLLAFMLMYSMPKICGCSSGGAAANAQPAANENLGSVQAGEATVVLYYFHRNVRCPACIGLEMMARQVVEENYAAETASGRLVWLVLNIDSADTKALARELNVVASTLLLAEMTETGTGKSKHLTNSWHLLNDYNAFKADLCKEIDSALQETL